MVRNWIDKVKKEYADNRREVMLLLNISETEYNNMWLDAGIQYLRDTLGLDEETITDIIETDVYWKWWFNQWQRWDKAFLREVGYESVSLRHKLYDQLHDPSETGFAPNRMLLANIFRRKVVDQLISE